MDNLEKLEKKENMFYVVRLRLIFIHLNIFRNLDFLCEVQSQSQNVSEKCVIGVIPKQSITDGFGVLLLKFDQS